MRISDWSSDVCSSDLNALTARFALDADVAPGFTLQFSADWTRRREASAGSTLLEVNATGLAPAINNTVTTAPTFGVPFEDRKSVVSGKSVSVRVDLGGRRIIKKQTKKHTYNN